MKYARQIVITGWLAAMFALASVGCVLVSQVAQAPTPTARATAAPVTQTPAPTPPRAKPASTPTASVIQLGLSGGVVVANTGSAIDLRIGGSTLRVQTTANTIMVVPGVKNAQLADIHAGDRVIADIPDNDPATPAALLLAIPSRYSAADVLTGVVLTNANGTINLKTDVSNRRVLADASTTVVNISGDQPALAAIDDAQPNSAVMVIGQPSGDTFTAQVIAIVQRNAPASK